MSRRTRKVIVKDSTGRRIIEQSRVRLLFVGLFFILCFTSIAVRMVDVAVINNTAAITILVSDLDGSKADEKVEIKDRTPTANHRGDIVDRNGVLIATSLTTSSIFVNPNEVQNKSEAAKKLAATLRLDEDYLLKRFKSKKSFVWVKRNLTPTQEQSVNALGIPGLYFLPEEKRVYPHGNLLSHVIGYVGVDDKGLAGIEKQYNQRLRDSSVNHNPLRLSLDTRLQAILHEEMQSAIEQFSALGGAGVIMDVRNGEIISIVSMPDFDPHHPAKGSKESRFNRAALGNYEMGSTFKTFTMAAALEHGIADMRKKFDAINPVKIARYTIRDSHPEKRWLTVPEIYAYSSNIGTARMIMEVGKARQRGFMDKLGMTRPVDIDFPEKGTPLVPDPWREINMVTISYGHGISVTPLHLVRGISAMVNGGILPELTLQAGMRKELDERRRVISEKTSKNVRRLMRLVVQHGTGSKADVEGYRVAGKTGTAEKVSGKKYDGKAKLASFVATFPMDDPKYVVLVMIDEPQGDKTTHFFATGGWIAAPVVNKVIARMGPLLNIRPVYHAQGDDAEKYWVEHEPKKKKQPKLAPSLAQRYLHAVSF